MKRLFACLSLCLLLAACASPSLHDERADERAADAAAAQALAASAPPVSEALDPWLQAQRARIETARADATQRFEADEKACWRRFAVNACVRAARADRRSVTDRLRQEELAVNEVERQRTSQARLRPLEEKQRSAAPQ